MNTALTYDGIIISASKGNLPLDAQEALHLLARLRTLEDALCDIVLRLEKQARKEARRHASTTIQEYPLLDIEPPLTD